MGKALKIVVAVIAVVAVSKTVQKLTAPSAADDKLAMERMVGELNAKAPSKVDNITTFTKANLQDKAVQFHYTLSGTFQFDSSLKQQFESAAVKQVCGGPMRVFSTQKMTVEFIYSYFGRNGLDILKINVPPSKCS